LKLRKNKNITKKPKHTEQQQNQIEMNLAFYHSLLPDESAKNEKEGN